MDLNGIFDFLNIYLFIVYVFVCIWVYTCHRLHVEIKGYLKGVGFLLPLCALQRLNLSCQPQHLYLISHLTNPKMMSFQMAMV